MKMELMALQIEVAVAGVAVATQRKMAALAVVA
jgi:hypothetical protein